MKKILLFLCLGLCTTPLLQARQQHPLRERIYVSTDKECYLCGENMWLSLFCFDLESGTPSNASAVAYIELQDLAQTRLSAKAALKKGRGSACLALPANLPTGTYCLTVYTRYQYAEAPGTLFRKIITLYNPLVSARTQTVAVNDTLQPAPQTSRMQESFGSLEIQPSAPSVAPRQPFTLTITNPLAQIAQTSVSVYRTETLNYVQNSSVAQYLQSLSKDNLKPVSGKETVDYAGEILMGHIEKDQIPVTDVSNLGLRAGLAIAGPQIQFFLGEISENGQARFFTSNLYGDGVLVSQVTSSVDSGLYRLVLDSVFAHKLPETLPTLYINPNQKEELLQRSMDVQLMNAYRLDTLHRARQLFRNLLYQDEGVEYKLDEYTRFPVMRDVIIEFVKEARWRSDKDGGHLLQVSIKDALGVPTFMPELTQSLVLLDGIPVNDHEKIYNYDPTQIESITLYPHQYAYGYIYYSGLVFIKTYKGKADNLDLGKTVRLQDFQGVQSPRDFLSGTTTEHLPDIRPTLYWNPSVTLQGGESTALQLLASDYIGDYTIVVEGMTEDGKPLRSVSRITVR